MAVFYEPEYEVVESILMRNKRTGTIRELDIRITHRQDPQKRSLVECRAHKRKQDVQWIDELDGKAGSLGFSKVIAISGSGFTKPALAEAADRGIEALHLKAAEERDWRKWMFGLKTFGVQIKFDPVVRGVSFGVPPQYVEKVPHPIDLSRVILLDLKRKSKCPLTAYIEGFQKDPKIVTQLSSMNENDAINHYDYKIPCDPGIGFAIEPDTTFIPLTEVIFHVDYVSADYSVPLEHWEIGGNRVLVGESIILGRLTKLVLHEMPGQLKVMFEQEAKRPNDPEK
jgi:hypothetical protein